jgi:mRNA interferase RelE/StbE
MQRLGKLRVPDEVAELIRNLHPHLKRKIKFSLRQILADPRSGKDLKDELQGMRSFRVSRFRIIYRLSQNKQIEIVAVGPRKTIYEETYILLKRTKKEGQ